jgi:pyrimidine and pyridine-specific 5'-nucleotidase
VCSKGDKAQACRDFESPADFKVVAGVRTARKSGNVRRNSRLLPRCMNAVTRPAMNSRHFVKHLTSPSSRFLNRSVPSYRRPISYSMASNGTSTNGVQRDNRKVFFFDIDNCLYPKSYQIHDKMAVLIDNYFQSHLSLSEEDATTLHQRYYKDYGLAIEGLVRHHKVDPLEYNEKVDDALPLDDIIKPDPKLRQLLQDIDSEKIRLWLFTNAYVNHGKRVTRLLGVDDLFGGMTFCDYAAERLLCKPSPEMFDKAMREANVTNVDDCYFVGTCYYFPMWNIPMLNCRQMTRG